MRLGAILNRTISFKHSALSEKENTMAVQQNKKSRSRKGMRRSHDRVATPAVIYCSCGEPTVPHSVCPSCGSYLRVPRGKGRIQIICPRCGQRFDRKS